MPLHGYLGCLLMEILVASTLPPRGELLSPCGELHFSNSFRRYDRASCILLPPKGLVTTFIGRLLELRNVVFWIDTLGPISLGDADVTVRIC